MPSKNIAVDITGQQSAITYSWGLDYISSGAPLSGVGLTIANSPQNTFSYPSAFNFYQGNTGNYIYDINVLAEENNGIACNSTKNIFVSLSCKLTDIQISNPSQSGDANSGYIFSWNGTVTGTPSNMSYAWTIYPAPIGFTVVTNANQYSITLTSGHSLSTTYSQSATKYTLTLTGKDISDNNSGNICMQTDSIDFYITAPASCTLKIMSIIIS